MVVLDGYRTADKSIESVVGETEKWELTLEATSNNATGVKDSNGIVVAPFDDTTKDRVASSKPNPWILVGGGVVTLGGLVTGLVYNVKANNAYDKAQALKDDFGRSGCYVGSASTLCGKQAGYVDDADRNRTISQVAFGVGGIALVATAAYWLWPRKGTSNPTTANTTVVSSVGPNGTWVGLSGSY